MLVTLFIYLFIVIIIIFFHIIFLIYSYWPIHFKFKFLLASNF